MTAYKISVKTNNLNKFLQKNLIVNLHQLKFWVNFWNINLHNSFPWKRYIKMLYNTTLLITLSCWIKFSAFIILKISIRLSLYWSSINKFILKLSSTSFKTENKLKSNPLEFYLRDHTYLTFKQKNSSLEVILEWEDQMAEEFILK